jgi:zinc and cadmium transporter
LEEGLLFGTTFLTGLLSFLFIKKEKSAWIKLLLSFSGAFLLSTCVMHIIPSIYVESEQFTEIGIYILLGFLLQIVLEFFSRGSEHGHAHLHGNKIPTGLIISLCIHAFWEGTPFGFHEHGDSHDHGHLLAGIIMHKLPVAVVLASMLKVSYAGKKYIPILILFIFSLMPVLGSFAGENIIGESAHVPSLAIVLGMMLHISTTILFEISENHRFNAIKLLSVIVGFTLSILTYSI